MTIDDIREKFPMYNQLSDEDLATRINSKYEDVGEIELIWEGMKAGIPELWHGAKQFGAKSLEKMGVDFKPETMRQIDKDASEYGRRNMFDIMGEDPSKKSFDTFNPYRTGKTLAQAGIPLGWPSKATQAAKGLAGLKARAKFGGKVGGVYGTALPVTSSPQQPMPDADYWEQKGTGVGLGVGGGILGGELFNALIKGAGAGITGTKTYGTQGLNLVKRLVTKIRGMESLPQTIEGLGSKAAMRELSSEVQQNIQAILAKADAQGGKISLAEATKIAQYESLGYPSGSVGAQKYPHEPLTPAQVTRDPVIAQEEIMVQGHPAMKQKMQEQANYMTGAVEKVSEELQAGAGVPRYTGEAGYPSARATGEEVAGVATKMKERLTGKTEKIYSEATAQYGKKKVKPTGFLRAVQQLEPDATAAEILAVAKGYESMVRSAMQKQARPYRGKRGTMKKDMWASGFGHEKPPPPPKADSLNVASLEGIRKKLTRQTDQLRRQGNLEGASVLRKLRNAIDADVEKAVGHDVYKAGRATHQVGMQKLDMPVVNKVLTGKYSDDFAKIVDDVKKMPYEQMMKLKQGMLSEGGQGKTAWKNLAAQIFHDMKEQGMRGYEGHGKGRLVSISTMENALKTFGKSARGLGANSEKGKLLFGDEMANKINDIIKLSKNLDVLGVAEVKTGWSAALNILDWGSKILGKVPSVTARGSASVMQGTRRAIGDASDKKYQKEIIERTLGGPIFAGMRGKKTGMNLPARMLLPSGAVRTGAVLGERQKNR